MANDCWDDQLIAWLKEQFWAKGGKRRSCQLPKNGQLEIVCKLRDEGVDSRKEFAYEMRNYAAETFVCQHTSYVILETDAKEGTRLLELASHPKKYGVRLAERVLRSRLGIYHTIPRPPLKKISDYFAGLTKALAENYWHLELIGAYRAQQITDGSGVKILVADTGVDRNHPELAHLFQKEDAGYNFVNRNKNIDDGNGHGTHVCGLVGGREVGVSPACDLYMAKVLNDEGWGSESAIVRAMEWAIDKGMDIMSMSLGSSSYSDMEADSIEALVKHGVTVLAAAGNDGLGPSYPASYPGVISVAAVDRDKEHADFSNMDPTVDISAPGVNVYSSIPGGRYGRLSGTSMATPLAAGAAALILSQERLDPESLYSLIASSAEHLGSEDDPSREEKFGAGLIRPDAALQLLSYDQRRSHGRAKQRV